MICIVVPISGILAMVRRTSLDDAVRISELELNTCGDALSGLISAASESSILLGKNEMLKKIASHPSLSSGKVAYDVYLAMREFNNIAPFTYDFKLVFLYYPSNSFVITPRSVFPSIDLFCKLNLDTISCATLQEALCQHDSSSRYFSFNNELFIFNDIVFEYPSAKKAVSCFNISKNSIDAAMKSRYEEGSYAILGSDGKILISTIPESMHSDLKTQLSSRVESAFFAELNGKEVLITKKYADSGKMLYISMLPVSSVTKRIDAVTNILYLSVSAVTLVGFTAILFLSRKNTKLIRSFVSEVYPEGAPLQKDEFGALESGIRTLHRANKNYKELLAKQRISLESAFFARLYMGAFANEVEMISAMNEAGLAITGSRFSVSLIYAGPEDLSAQMALTNTFDEQIYIHPLKEDVYIMLFAGNEEKDIARLVQEKFPFDLRIVTGKTVSSLKEVYESYLDAIQSQQEEEALQESEEDQEEKPSDLIIHLLEEVYSKMEIEYHMEYLAMVL